MSVHQSEAPGNCSESNAAHTPKSMKLTTRNGYFIRFITGNMVICFFVNKQYQHVLWKLTLDRGMLPATQEYNRLKTQVKLIETPLTPNETVLCGRIARELSKDPYHGLDARTREMAVAFNACLQSPVPVSGNEGYRQKAVPVPKKQPIPKPAKEALVAARRGTMKVAVREKGNTLGEVFKGFFSNLTQKLSSQTA